MLTDGYMGAELMDRCEMCNSSRRVDWCLVDDDFEQELCQPCQVELRREVNVKVLEVAS